VGGSVWFSSLFAKEGGKKRKGSPTKSTSIEMRKEKIGREKLAVYHRVFVVFQKKRTSVD